MLNLEVGGVGGEFGEEAEVGEGGEGVGTVEEEGGQEGAEGEVRVDGELGVGALQVGHRLLLEHEFVPHLLDLVINHSRKRPIIIQPAPVEGQTEMMQMSR